MPTKIIVTDGRLLIAGNSVHMANLCLKYASNALACILAAQGLLTRPVEISADPYLWDMLFYETDLAKQGVAGFLNCAMTINMKYPGVLAFEDKRSAQVLIFEPPQPEPIEETVESFALTTSRIIKPGTIGKPFVLGRKPFVLGRHMNHKAA